MMSIKKLVSVFCLMMVLYSCTYNKGDLVYPGNGGVCDSAGVISYNQKLVPIFQSNCYSCHTTSFQSGGVDLSTYASVKTVAVNGKLYGVISHSPGFVAMPQGGVKLSNCQIATIKKWIDAGSPNN